MRLLIAEDDKALGLFLSRGLEADGHQVRLVCDGGKAVEAFREEMPASIASSRRSRAICRFIACERESCTVTEIFAGR